MGNEPTACAGDESGSEPLPPAAASGTVSVPAVSVGGPPTLGVNDVPGMGVGDTPAVGLGSEGVVGGAPGVLAA